VEKVHRLADSNGNSSTWHRRRPSREHLTSSEIKRLIEAAQDVARHGVRDSRLILVAYRHGLRVSELVGLRWDQVDLDRRTLHVNRLQARRRRYPPAEWGGGISLTWAPLGSSSVGTAFQQRAAWSAYGCHCPKDVARAGQTAGLEFPVRPHMLRQATGYYLANQGVDHAPSGAYLGHRNIMHTVRYTQLAPDRFRAIWCDE